MTVEVVSAKGDDVVVRAGPTLFTVAQGRLIRAVHDPGVCACCQRAWGRGLWGWVVAAVAIIVGLAG